MEIASRIRLAGLMTIISVTWWIASVVVLHFVTAAHYRPIEQPISDMTHGPYGVLVDIGLIVLGVGTIALAAGLFWSLNSARFGPALLGATGFLWIVAGMFQTGPGGEFQADTSDLEATVHDGAAFLAFLISMLVMFIFARTFRRHASWNRFERPALLLAILGLAGFLLFFVLGEERFGLAQRIFIGVLMTWLLATALQMRAIAPELKTDNG